MRASGVTRPVPRPGRPDRPGPAAPPVRPARPGLVAVPPVPEPVARPAAERPEAERLRQNLARVLAGLRWPAFRWQVLAEAEAWGVSGVTRGQLQPLPDGRYPSLDAVLEMLAAVARGGLRSAPGPSAPPPAGRPAVRPGFRPHLAHPLRRAPGRSPSG